MSFEHIVGNEKVKQFLKKTIDENHILHSYLFVGPSGIGKKLFAKEFAKQILGLDVASEKAFESKNHPDFYQIEPENKTIKIEQIRNLQEKIAEKPIASNRKVYLIIDSDAMTKEAQNCLLKTLEEPPQYATILLLTDKEEKLLSTIKSRCMKLSFKPISKELLEQYFEEKWQIKLSPQFLEASQGSIGMALKLQAQDAMYKQVDEVLEAMEGKDFLTIVHKAEIFYKEKDNIQDILDYMNIHFYKTGNLKKMHCIEYIEETKRRILANSNYDMCIDFLLMKIEEEMTKK